MTGGAGQNRRPRETQSERLSGCLCSISSKEGVCNVLFAGSRMRLGQRVRLVFAKRRVGQ